MLESLAIADRTVISCGSVITTLKHCSKLGIELVVKHILYSPVKIWSIEQVERAQKLNYIEKIDSKLKHAIVFGNEIKGVDQKIIDISKNTIEIDQYGTKHSLNVSVAAGIVIWKFYNSLS